MRKKKRILLIGGGSGGHIMPNLAIAEELRSNCGSAPTASDRGPVSTTSKRGTASRESHCEGIELLYIGSKNPLDQQLVKPSGIPFKSIFTGKIRRYFSWQNFIDPFFVILGFLQSFWIVIRFWPHAVFTKGGFVSVPVALAAWVLRRPIILHESDSRMGLSNKIVAKLARHVCLGFPIANDQLNPKSEIRNPKYVLMGNPVRESILHGDKEKGFELTGFRPEKPVVLVWGGSQGAQQINDLISDSFERLKGHFQIIHITGKTKQTELADEAYCQFEYLGEELKHIYAITDLVVSRAGANSLYELALMRKPNVLIPLESAAHNHQQFNAEYFEKEGASLILRDQPLFEVLNALWHNPAKLQSMRQNLEKLSKPNATADIVQLLLIVSRKS